MVYTRTGAGEAIDSPAPRSHNDRGKAPMRAEPSFVSEHQNATEVVGGGSPRLSSEEWDLVQQFRAQRAGTFPRMAASPARGREEHRHHQDLPEPVREVVPLGGEVRGRKLDHFMRLNPPIF
ncbi:hypothetical protein Dimus_037887 [Dionaea muscipula]